MCDNPDCKCPYCKNDNYDRYIGDHLRQMLNEINHHMPEPVKMSHPDIDEDEELYYKVIKRRVVEILDPDEKNESKTITDWAEMTTVVK